MQIILQCKYTFLLMPLSAASEKEARFYTLDLERTSRDPQSFIPELKNTSRTKTTLPSPRRSSGQGDGNGVQRGVKTNQSALKTRVRFGGIQKERDEKTQ